MGQEPRDIEQQIEQTRERMGETVEALTSKADVPGRVKGYVGDKRDVVMSKVPGMGGRSDGDSSGPGMTQEAKHMAQRSAGMAKDNPLGLAVAGVAAGFVVGTLLPSTSVEDERLGPIADDIKHQAREVGSEAVEHGKEIAGEVAQQTADTAKQHGEELRESVAQRTP